MSRNRNRISKDSDEAAAEWVFRLEGGLNPEQAAAFEAWRVADPSHEAALARHSRAWAAFDRPRKAGQADLVLNQLAKRATTRKRRNIGAAATALVILLAAGIYWQSRPVPAVADMATRAVLVVPEKRVLPDGSVVELKAGATIAVNFSGPFRRVALTSGEAHFQVAKNKERPFVVTAGNVEFRAVGTAFSVQLGAKQVELLVTEGRVAVNPEATAPNSGTPAGGVGPGQISGLPPSDLLVDAGSRLIVALAPASLAPTPTSIPDAEMAERLAWLAPRLEFTDTPLAEAIAQLNRHNREQFVIEDQTLAQLPVSGLFRADRAEAFTRLLEANFGVRAEIFGDRIILHRKP